MKLIPYSWPLFSEFNTARFIEATRKAAPEIDAMIGEDPAVWQYPGTPWVAGPPLFLNYTSKSKKLWRAKVYICLSAKDYWRGILALGRCMKRNALPWKFYRTEKGNDRPDKIVVYFDSERALRAAIPRIRKALEGCSFRTMHHAASTADMGFEDRSAKGLYVGSDPTFIPYTSWRGYRCLTYAWLTKSRDYLESLPGGIERWCERMNISLDHEGPRTVEPRRDHSAYVRRYWRLIYPVEMRGKTSSTKKTVRRKSG